MGIALFQKLFSIAISPSRSRVRQAQEAQPPAVNGGKAWDAPKRPLVFAILKAIAHFTEPGDKQPLGF